MNLHELNCVPVFKNVAVPSQTTQTSTTFLTTHLPLAVESLTKTTKHASATVSQRAFGPNDCIVMTTWLEKFAYSTMKTSTVGKPVVSDSIEVPRDFHGAAFCPQEPPVQARVDLACSAMSMDGDGTTTQSSVEECTPYPTPTTCTSSDNPSRLEDVLVEMAEESEDEICTDSEDEVCTDSEDEVDSSQ